MSGTIAAKVLTPELNIWHKKPCNSLMTPAAERRKATKYPGLSEFAAKEQLRTLPWGNGYVNAALPWNSRLAQASYRRRKTRWRTVQRSRSIRRNDSIVILNLKDSEPQPSVP